MYVLFFLETHFKKLLILGVKAIISGDLTVRKALNNRAQDGAGEGGGQKSKLRNWCYG